MVTIGKRKKAKREGFIFNDTVIKVRTISKILIEADETTDLNVLYACWEEIVKNKYYYPIIEIEFAREHLDMLEDKLLERGIN